MRIFAFVFLNLLCVQLMAQGLFSPSSRDPFTGYNGSNIKKMTANKVVSYSYDAETLVNTRTVNYSYSDNGLTVTDDSGNIYVFYPDGKMKSRKIPIHGIDETYTYTNDGKLLSIESPYSICRCYYTNTGIDSLVRWSYSDRLKTFLRYGKEIATYNQDGYKYTEYRYITEENVYRLESETLYEFDKQDRLVKKFSINDNDISLQEERIYSENKIQRYFCSNGKPSLKDEYVYNDKDDLIEYAYFYWTVGDHWFRGSTISYTYSYDEITSNEQMNLSKNCQIFTFSNNIVIENAKYGERVNVYDILGNFCYSGVINSGRYIIDLPNNHLYIIKIGEKSIKLKL